VVDTGTHHSQCGSDSRREDARGRTFVVTHAPGEGILLVTEAGCTWPLTVDKAGGSGSARAIGISCGTGEQLDGLSLTLDPSGGLLIALHTNSFPDGGAPKCRRSLTGLARRAPAEM
jgi:hypothetical protein